MQFFTQIIPVIIGFLTIITVPTLPASIILFIVSLVSKEEESKKKYRKVSFYLIIPLLLIILLSIIWGVIGLINAYL